MARFCLQGSSAAHAKLAQLLVNHEALTAHTDPLSAKADSGGDEIVSLTRSAQEKQDLTACREDIVSIIQAMFSHLQGKDLVSVVTPGYGTFGDIALPYGLAHIHKGFLEKRMQVSPLCCYSYRYL